MAGARKLLAEGWASYFKAVYPIGVSDAQRQECERAFYAGASWFFSAVAVLSDGGSEATDADVTILNGMVDEMDAFAALINLQHVRPKGNA